MKAQGLTSAFFIGHKEIDGEHGELIEVLNGMATGYMTKDTAVCKQKWQEFCEKLEDHSRNEEKIMDELGFDSKQHKEQHNILLKNSKSAGDECETLEEWNKCFFELRHQIMRQILKHDLRFAEHLYKIGYN